MPAFVQTVLRTLRRHRMIADGARVGVAVSGGADSVALLEVLIELGAPRAWQLEVLHLDHALRGAASDADRAFVEALAARHGLPCHVRRVDVRQLKGNLEQSARRARYAFFVDMRRERALDCIATGHTASDQAETVLQRLMRGASPTSMAGIRAVREGHIVRPLLDVTRDEVRVWLLERGVTWREDASNEELNYERNRVRATLLPTLARDFNPHVEHALARYAATCARDEQYWTAVVDDLESHVAQSSVDGLLIDVAMLATAPTPAQARLWPRLAARVATKPVRLDQTHIDALLALTASHRGEGRVALPRLLAWRSYSTILLAPGRAPRRVKEETVVRVPGQVGLRDGAGQVVARVTVGRPGTGAASYNRSEIDARLPEGDGAALELVLRGWRAGDRMRPEGRATACTLHDLFDEKRVKAWERLRWPVLAWRDQLVWSRAFGRNADGPHACTGLQIEELDACDEPMNQITQAWRQNN